MEEARYWMCAKRKHDELIAPLSNNPPSSSWEEQAFAEDAAGILGGCVWPPRSYTCSFCRREFRSAQALGGHMNVHRRDRARLKQSPPNSHEHDQLFVPPNHNNHVLNPSQIRTFLYNPSSDPSVPIRVSSQKTFTTQSSFSSSHVQEQTYKNKLTSSPLSWSNLVADKYSCDLSNMKNEKNKLKSIDQSIIWAKQGHVETDLSFNLNFVVCRNQESNGTSVEEAVTNCKRRRLIEETIPFEELDLELRLGETPKVK